MIKNSKTIFIKHFYDAESSYTTNIYIDFNPHEMLVKKIDFFAYEDEESAEMLIIRSNIVNDYIGYTRNLTVNISNELQTRFLINQPVRGAFNFTIHNINDELYQITGNFVICLEFIEYLEL